MRYQEKKTYSLVIDAPFNRAEVMAMVAYCVHKYEDDAPCSYYDQIMSCNFKYDALTSDVKESTVAYEVMDDGDEECARICVYTRDYDNDCNWSGDSVFVRYQTCQTTYEDGSIGRVYDTERDWALDHNDVLALGLCEDWETECQED